MNASRLAIALLAVSASLLPLTSAGALSVPTATQLTLPTPNNGLNQGYLPFQSCTTVGNCTVSGIYVTTHGAAAGVLDSEVKGVWKPAITVTPPPGYQAAKGVTMDGLTCPATGSCVALGQYNTPTSQLPFVESQVKGVWHRGTALVLPANAVGTGQAATPHAISCASTGNCTVVGTYTTKTSGFATQGFFSSEVHGVWHHALELTLPAGANADPLVALAQVSCWSAGNCVVVGSYVGANDVSLDVVVPEIAGKWKSAQAVGLPGNASAFAGAQFSEVSCTPSGSCMAVGTYNTASGAVQPLVALGTGAQWTRALEVHLPTSAAKNPQTLIYGFQGASCAAPGDCALGGQFIDTAGHYQGFFDDVVNGNVQGAQVLRLPAGAVQAGHNGGVVSISCPAIGTCFAGAAYLNAANKYEALIVHETKNVWQLGATISLPNGATSVGVAGGVYSVQCFSTSSCTATGSYQSSASRYDGFALTTAA
ncbi:MAG TPA: hypothetical protein VIJ86_11930 [Acidimicrobiales bacterium]